MANKDTPQPDLKNMVRVERTTEQPGHSTHSTDQNAAEIVRDLLACISKKFSCGLDSRNTAFEMLLRLADEDVIEAKSALSQLGRAARFRKQTQRLTTIGDAVQFNKGKNTWRQRQGN